MITTVGNMHINSRESGVDCRKAKNSPTDGMIWFWYENNCLFVSSKENLGSGGN